MLNNGAGTGQLQSNRQTGGERLVLVVCGTLLVETLFYALLTPLVPTYDARFGLSKFGAGVLVGSYAGGAVLGAVPAGYSAVRWGLKRTTVCGLGILSVFCLPLMVPHVAWELDLARLVQGVGAAFCLTGSMAWLVTLTVREQRGRMIGLVTAAATTGSVVGPAVGAAAVRAGTELTFGVLGAVTAVFAVWAARVPPPTQRPAQQMRLLLSPENARNLSPGVWYLLLPSLVLGLLNVLAPLRLSKIGFSASMIAAVFSIAAACQVFANLVVGRWTDHSGAMSPIRACLAGTGIAATAITLAEGNWALSLGAIGLTATAGALYTPAMTVLADRAEQAGVEQGVAFVLLNIGWAPGQLLGSAGGGAVAGATADWVPYVMVTSMCLMTLGWLRRERIVS